MVEEAIESVSVAIDPKIHILPGDASIERDLIPVDLIAQIEEEEEEDALKEEREATHQEVDTQIEVDQIDQEIAEEGDTQETLRTAEM